MWHLIAWNFSHSFRGNFQVASKGSLVGSGRQVSWVVSPFKKQLSTFPLLTGDEIQLKVNQRWHLVCFFPSHPNLHHLYKPLFFILPWICLVFPLLHSLSSHQVRNAMKYVKNVQVSGGHLKNVMMPVRIWNFFHPKMLISHLVIVVALWMLMPFVSHFSLSSASKRKSKDSLALPLHHHHHLI